MKTLVATLLLLLTGLVGGQVVAYRVFGAPPNASFSVAGIGGERQNGRFVISDIGSGDAILSYPGTIICKDHIAASDGSWVLMNLWELASNLSGSFPFCLLLIEKVQGRWLAHQVVCHTQEQIDWYPLSLEQDSVKNRKIEMKVAITGGDLSLGTTKYRFQMATLDIDTGEVVLHGKLADLPSEIPAANSRSAPLQPSESPPPAKSGSGSR